MGISVIGAAGVRVGQPNEAVYSASGTFTVPDGVTSVEAIVVGGGGGGGYAANSGESSGGGGAVVRAVSYVTPGETVNVIVGAGGAKASSGGASSFGNLYADGGSSVGNSGSYSLDSSLPGYIPVQAAYDDTQTLSQYGYFTGAFARNSEYVISNHGSSLSNGDYAYKFWNPAINAVRKSVTRGWSTGVNSGISGTRAIKFKDNYVILMYNSNPAITTGSSAYYGSIRYATVASIETGTQNVEMSMPTLPAAYTGTDIMCWLDNDGTFEHDGYLYLATKVGILRTFDGITWTEVINTWGPGNLYVPNVAWGAHIWINNDGILYALVPNGTSTHRVMATTDNTFSAWQSTVTNGNSPDSGFRHDYPQWSRKGGTKRGIYDSANNRYTIMLGNTTHTNGSAGNLRILDVAISGNTTAHTTTISGYLSPTTSGSSMNFDLGTHGNASFINADKLYYSGDGWTAVFTRVPGSTTSWTNITPSLTIRREYVNAGVNWSDYTEVGNTTWNMACRGSSSGPVYDYYRFSRLINGSAGNTGVQGQVGAGAGGQGFQTGSGFWIGGAALDGFGAGSAIGMSSGGGNNTSAGAGVRNTTNTYESGQNGTVILKWRS
jgi:hypothetical protein